MWGSPSSSPFKTGLSCAYDELLLSAAMLSALKASRTDRGGAEEACGGTGAAS